VFALTAIALWSMSSTETWARRYRRIFAKLAAPPRPAAIERRSAGAPSRLEYTFQSSKFRRRR
jgi:hypothetical protein